MHPLGQYLLITFAFVFGGMASSRASSPSIQDSLPTCGWLCFLSEWNLKPYTLDPTNKTLNVGTPWGPIWSSGSNIPALLRHPEDQNNNRLYGFYDGWIGYTPDKNGTTGPLQGTGHYIPGTYRYIAGSDSFAILHAISLNPLVHYLYSYNLTTPPSMLRNDLDISTPHIATDRHHRAYVAIREPGTNFSTASILVLDSLGYGRWEFNFDPPLSVYNAMGMAVIGDELYLSLGSLNPSYPNKLVQLVLDCSSGQAIPTDNLVWLNTSFSGLTSGTPGDPMGECPPNTDQPPAILTSLHPADRNPVVDISPNPVTSTLFIRSNSNQEWSATLRYLTGSVVWTVQFQGDLAWPVDGLPAGVYVLQVTSHDVTYACPIIKE